MARVFNFSAGPSMLPLPVLQKAQAELLEYGCSGQSVLEMSHRSSWFEEIIAGTEAALRRVLNVPENYKVGFFQGGASTQFAAVPLNLMGTGSADYIVTGQFSGKAAKEAEKYGTVNIIASSKDKNFTYIPDAAALKFTPGASYVHICQNNTIYGTRWPALPATGALPLVADMTSCILSEPVVVSQYGLIYFGVQKNVAPAGMAVVIVREDLIGHARPATPAMLDYATVIGANSMYNTPPCFCIYMMGLVLEWLENEVGGLAAMQRRNEEKAALLYDYLDASRFFKNPVEKPFRSMMNVTFTSPSPELDKAFCAEAAQNGLVNLKGHRSVGGMRASIYNAMPLEGVQALVAFMQKFEAQHI